MQSRIFRIPLLFLIFGICWAITSDPVISFLTKTKTLGISNSIKGFNDLIFVLMASAFIFIIIKAEQKKLKDSEMQYRTLFLTNPNPMWIYHVDSLKFIAVNDATIKKYGYSRKEFMGMTIKDLRPKRDYDNLEQAIRAGGITISNGQLWTHLLKSGEEIIVSITSHRLTFNHLRCSMVMINDVTEVEEGKQRAELALKKEKELNDELEKHIELIKNAHQESHRMAEIMNKISNLVLIVNDQGYITWVNQAFTSFTGFTFHEACGKKPNEILFGAKTNQKVADAMIDAVSENKFFSGEIIYYKKNGEPYWSQVNVSSIFDNDGRFNFFISVETVITERKEKEAQLNSQYKVFREVAWTNSHEIRSPLCSILGLIELIKQTDDEHEKMEYLATLEHCSLELDSMIKENVRKINALESSVNPFTSHVPADAKVKSSLF